MRLLCHPDHKDITLAGVLYALGDPIRLAVVQRLAVQGELTCVALEIPIAKSTLSHHLKVLRESGVICSRREGTQHLSSLRREELDTLFPGLLAAVLRACVLAEAQLSKKGSTQAWN